MEGGEGGCTDRALLGLRMVRLVQLSLLVFLFGEAREEVADSPAPVPP